MSSRTITGGERLSRNDKGSGIGPKVLEEVGETIKHDETFNRSGCGGESIVTKTYPRLASADSISKTIHELTHGGEQNCEYAESHKLNWFSSPRVDEKERCIISRDKTSSRKDEIPDTDIL
jgi:hypothetical protein